MPTKNIFKLNQGDDPNRMSNDDFSKSVIFDFMSFCDSLGTENPYSFKTFLKKTQEAECNENEEILCSLEKPYVGQNPAEVSCIRGRASSPLSSPIIISELPEVGTCELGNLFFPHGQDLSEVHPIQLLKSQPMIQTECCCSSGCLPNSLQDMRKINLDEQLKKDNILNQLKEENVQLNQLLQKSNKSLRLAQENYVLKAKLRNLSCLLNDKTQRVDHLEKELRIQCHKDKEETVTLEKMVQQVEHNLKVSTERALKAESLVSKLKQELKDKEAELNTLKRENKELRKNASLTEINRNAQNLSRQLLKAAEMAEAPTRALVKGISHLRLLAAMVADIAKVTENDSS